MFFFFLILPICGQLFFSNNKSIIIFLLIVAVIVINVYLLRFCSPVVIGQILVLETLFLQAPKYCIFLEDSRQMYSMNR